MSPLIHNRCTAFNAAAVFTALRIKHASAVYAAASPSVRPSVCLSVTLRYCVKTRERRGMRSSPPGSPVSLVFCCQEWLVGDDHVQVKFECKEVGPCENSPAVHISLHNSRTVIDSEKVQLRRIENRPWAFQRAINQGRRAYVTLTSAEWGSDTQIWRFFAEISTKRH